MESVLAVRDEYRMQNWAKIIGERQESGLTVKDYCAQHGIAEKTYYYWLRSCARQRRKRWSHSWCGWTKTVLLPRR